MVSQSIASALFVCFDARIWRESPLPGSVSGSSLPNPFSFAEDPSLIIGCDYTVFRVDGEPESRYGILHGGSRTIKSRDPIGCLFGGTWKSSSATGKES